jgi:glycosyltransferase involved in cell wall biosynthesis
MEITVIIPTYKPKYYIKECIYSIGKQSLSPDKYEVIIILNGTKEPYLSIINEYTDILKCDNRVYFTEIKGVSNARNIGIENAKGDYVCFIDDDDLISDNYLEELLNKAATADVVVSNVKNFTKDISLTEDDYLTKYFYNNYCKKKINILSIRGYFSTSCAKIISLDVIGNRRFNRRFAIGEDCLFMAEISDRIKRISLTNEDVIYYRRLRKLSVSNRPRVFNDTLWDAIRYINEYSKIFISNPLKYNFLFFSTRILGAIKGIAPNRNKI